MLERMRMKYLDKIREILKMTEAGRLIIYTHIVDEEELATSNVLYKQ